MRYGQSLKSLPHSALLAEQTLSPGTQKGGAEDNLAAPISSAPRPLKDGLSI